MSRKPETRFPGFPAARLASTAARIAVLILFAVPASVRAVDAPRAGFVGQSSCSTVGCHGGGTEQHDQIPFWHRNDVHRRASATLVTPRARALGRGLGLAAPAAHPRCTSCHSPARLVPQPLRIGDLQADVGVSCENCHGPAEPWLRYHARPDLTHADRVAAGMRDLRDPRARAGACVACHQTLDPAIAAAGHPVLRFELDGQALAEPRHWRESPDWRGPRAWFVGQAVALRESSWQLERLENPAPSLLAAWEALRWIVERAAARFPPSGLTFDPVPATGTAPLDFGHVRARADALARRASDGPWPDDLTRSILLDLSASADVFRAEKTDSSLQAARAERLVLALDRLLAGDRQGASSRASSNLDALFAAAQVPADFDARKFGLLLEAFHRNSP